MMYRQTCRRAAGTLLKALPMLALQSPAFAQHSSSTSDSDQSISVWLKFPSKLDFHGHIGIATGVFPENEGADGVVAVALPLLDLRQTDFVFLEGASVNPSEGDLTLAWNALNLEYARHSVPKFKLSFGPLVRFRRGRDEGDNSAQDRLGDLAPNVAIGGFVEAMAGTWSARLIAVAQEAGLGPLVSFRTRYTFDVTKDVSLTPGLFTNWGDFGGKDLGFEAGAAYSLFEHVELRGQLGYQRLLGDAAESSFLVDGSGSRDQFRALLGVAYKF